MFIAFLTSNAVPGAASPCEAVVLLTAGFKVSESFKDS